MGKEAGRHRLKYKIKGRLTRINEFNQAGAYKHSGRS